jgi:predicted amidohydrolase YtcJ
MSGYAGLRQRSFHYMLGYALQTVGTMVDMNTDSHKFMTEILPAAAKRARENGSTTVFGQGWNLASFQSHIPIRQELDAVCSDIPVYFLDDECHKAITNTLMLVRAGIMKEDGTDMAGLKVVMRIAATKKDFDYDKFYRAYADGFLTKDTLQYAYGRINDVHPMHYLRINCTLQQFDEFLNFYGITEGDGMYLAPQDRVAIW